MEQLWKTALFALTLLGVRDHSGRRLGPVRAWRIAAAWHMPGRRLGGAE